MWLYDLSRVRKLNEVEVLALLADLAWDSANSTLEAPNSKKETGNSKTTRAGAEPPLE